MNTTISISKETKNSLELLKIANKDMNIDDFVNKAILFAINKFTREKLGGIMATPIPNNNEKSVVEMLREARENGDIMREIQRLYQEQENTKIK